jgi:cation transport ATPase
MYNNNDVKFTEPYGNQSEDIKNSINVLVKYQNEVIHEQHNELLSLTNTAIRNTTHVNNVTEQLKQCIDEKKSLQNIADIYSARYTYYIRMQFLLVALLFIVDIILFIYIKYK